MLRYENIGVLKCNNGSNGKLRNYNEHQFIELRKHI
jgi:DNA-binding transcriptional MerR regulator